MRIEAEEAGISWKLTALVDRSAAEAALAASVAVSYTHLTLPTKA